MLADKIVLKFKRPGKDDSKAMDKMASDEPDMGKKDAPEEENGEYTRADLGKAFRMAMESKDDEAIYEACKKMMECSPSDDK